MVYILSESPFEKTKFTFPRVLSVRDDFLVGDGILCPSITLIAGTTYCCTCEDLCEFIRASVLLCVEESFGVVFVFGVIHPLWLLTVFLSSLLHSSLGPEGRV